MKFEEIIRNDEIYKTRSTENYINWIENKLKIIKENKNDKELKQEGLLRQNRIAKIFWEELYPFYILLKHKLKVWRGVEVSYAKKCCMYDFELHSNRKDIPHYIEITIGSYDYKERLRMEKFLKDGYVSRVGDVRRTKNGEILMDNIAVTKEKMSKNLKDKIENLLIKKTKIKRLENTALFISFDDSIYPWPTLKRELDEFLDTINIDWNKAFSCLYIVGESGEIFIERRK